MPDIADLNDWIIQHHPQVFEATKYLQPSVAYDAWLVIWQDAGSPTDRFESALHED